MAALGFRVVSLKCSDLFPLSMYGLPLAVLFKVPGLGIVVSGLGITR